MLSELHCVVTINVKALQTLRKTAIIRTMWINANTPIPIYRHTLSKNV